MPAAVRLAWRGTACVRRMAASAREDARCRAEQVPDAFRMGCLSAMLYCDGTDKLAVCLHVARELIILEPIPEKDNEHKHKNNKS